MRLLLISDTHGQLDIINYYAQITKADLILHAGDFGFYLPESVGRLPKKEIVKLLRHNWEYRVSGTDAITADTPREELERIALKYHIYGELIDYVEGRKRFNVPIVAVHGNHGDAVVVTSCSIPNLSIISLMGPYDLGGAYVVGLGGNITDKVIDCNLTKSIFMRHGQLCANYNNLYTVAKALTLSREIPSILLSHLSPETEPLITALAQLGNVPFTVSGHMHHLDNYIWECTVEEYENAKQRLEELKERFQTLDWKPFKLDKEMRPLTHINLVPAKVGYAVINFLADNGEYAWEVVEHKP